MAQKSPTPFDQAQLQKCIDESGFPFQFQVVDALVKRGYEIAPSHCIYDARREASCEIDMAAILRQKYERPLGDFTLNVNLAIECKDTEIPFVSFGLKHRPQVRRGFDDEDVRFLHLISTRDNTPGMFHRPALDPKGGLKPLHHQLNREDRFYTMTTGEWSQKNERWNLHTTENIANIFSKFAALTDSFDRQWDEIYDKPELEKMTGGAVIGALYLMVVHSGKQYEVLAGSKQPVESHHTPVMVSYGMPHGNLAFVIDVVPFDHFQQALDAVEKTCVEVARQLQGPFLNAKPIRVPQKNTPIIPERF